MASGLTHNIIFKRWRAYYLVFIAWKMLPFLVFCLFTSIDARNKVSISSGLSLPRDEGSPSPDTSPNPLNDANVPLPVFFNHIGREGVGDLPSGLKQPVDLLELDMWIPRTEQEKRYHLRRKPLTNIQFIDNGSRPQEKYVSIDFSENEKNNSNPREGQRWFDFESIHKSNDQNYPKKPSPKSFTKLKKKEGISVKEQEVFSGNSFDLMPQFKYPSMNWTNCDNFALNSQFHPKDIVGFEWIPFYTWTTRSHVVAYLHRFSFPTLKVVQEYKDEYGPFLSSKIDWNAPKLLLKEEVESLLISADRRGLFYMIKRHGLPQGLKGTNSKFQLPELTVRFKIVDPYLAMMYCVDHFAILMAISGDDPHSDEKKNIEAAKLKFEGIGFPIARDLAFEKLQKQIEIQRKIEEEETRFRTGIGVNNESIYL